MSDANKAVCDTHNEAVNLNFECKLKQALFKGSFTQSNSYRESDVAGSFLRPYENGY